MIKEAYVSFEVAKFLKEKGFKCKCTSWYISFEDGDVKRFTSKETVDYNHAHARWCVSCPTHQMAMAWLRKTHNIDICVFPYQVDYIDYSYETKIYKDKKMYLTITDSKTYENAVEIALKYILNIILI